ncbi:peptidoglycan DD-metalloendopeptidase family protein [Virgibacillus halodenitrificans]|nr:peptidoglycan DD-metalloendopeptidase family protein [Virgibacillus halodenitrificans]MYL56837.1 peptidoglycan DD-metalloendopeptidase family protein [Virgibacillus halodenitrificans]
MQLKIISIFICMLILYPYSPKDAFAAESDIYEKRMALFKKTEAISQIPWYYFAAMDNYERNIQKEDDDQLISISFDPEIWFGPGNSLMIQDEKIITFFQGKGKDGNGDNKADPGNPEDILHTMANMILEYGPSRDDIRIALWNFYQRDLSVQTIMNTAKVFKKFKDINLTDRDFPVSMKYNYSYNNTWGDRRGFGGLRIHEGTDIFASYGTPVKSTTYGVVELMGWNLYGGWRIGIRDIYNIYHYYAHMNGYSEDLKVGQVVKPGDVLGSVGSTGYGPPGTSGKFPPHLHYGMYKDNGHSEWSFDPYPYLKKWERMAR